MQSSSMVSFPGCGGIRGNLSVAGMAFVLYYEKVSRDERHRFDCVDIDDRNSDRRNACRCCAMYDEMMPSERKSPYKFSRSRG